MASIIQLNTSNTLTKNTNTISLLRPIPYSKNLFNKKGILEHINVQPHKCVSCPGVR